MFVMFVMLLVQMVVAAMHVHNGDSRMRVGVIYPGKKDFVERVFFCEKECGGGEGEASSRC